MTRKRSCRKGFTLIEILIVVVILAVLAAMILPRFANQTERAAAAEAFQVLGIIRSGAGNTFGSTQSYGSEDIKENSGGMDTGDWNALGLKQFNPKGDVVISYSPNATGYEAYVDLSADNGDNKVTVTAANGVDTWACTGIFKLRADNGGCTI